MSHTDLKIVDKSFLRQGDHSETEGMLRFRRIRVERHEVIAGDNTPLLCCAAGQIFLAGGCGQMVCSNDGGRTWETVGRIEPSSSNNRLCVLGLNKDKALMAVFETGDNLELYVSDDDGLSWQAVFTIEGIKPKSDLPGRLLELPEGSLLLCIDAMILKSSDNGATWTRHAALPAGWRGLRPLVLSDGQLIAAVFIEDDKRGVANTFIVHSEDNGRTWHHPECVTRKDEVPGDLLLLSGNRLVLTYGQKSNPYGARAVVSIDKGTTWQDYIYVLSTGRWNGPKKKPRPVRCSQSFGTASIVLEDGTIISAFDRGKTEKRSDQDGNQSAIGIVRWTVEGLNKPPLLAGAGQGTRATIWNVAL